MTPDDFLIHQFYFDKDQVLSTLEQQASKIGVGVPALLARLVANAPQFASPVEGALGE